MATMNISVPDQMKKWVEEQSTDGEFSNSSDYLRHLIRGAMRRDRTKAELDTKLQAGIDSGIGRHISEKEFVADRKVRQSDAA